MLKTGSAQRIATLRSCYLLAILFAVETPQALRRVNFAVATATKPVHCQNGDKLKRRNPKRQEIVGLCEAFKQLFRAYNT